MTQNIIETIDLTKKFKLKGKNQEIVALNKTNVSVRKGEIFGLLGPNGAGKTTMIQILTTLIQPTSGVAIIDGYDVVKEPNQAKQRISLMLGPLMLYNRLTGYSNLKFFCKMYNVSNYNEKINEMAKQFGLERWLNQYAGEYSSGMRMKLALCRTLLLDREILFLDEPTLGLDVKYKSFIINKLKNLNYTIFLTSHDMDVVEKMCDRIAFINTGNIIKIGTKDDIKRLEEIEIKIEIEIIENKKKLKDNLVQFEYVKDIIETNNGFDILINNRANYQDLLFVLGKYKILKIKELDKSLEDLFLKFFS